MNKQKNLKAVIREKGFMQQHVAKQAGINKWKMSKIINGHIQPTQDEIDRIANFLDEAPDKIFI